MNSHIAGLAPVFFTNSVNQIRCCCYCCSGNLAQQVRPHSQSQSQSQLKQKEPQFFSQCSRSSSSTSNTNNNTSNNMSKHGAVLLGQVRLFMCRSGVQSMRPIELSGLRVTPVTTQRFAALQLRQAQHRSFASSSSSSTSDDEVGKKQDKHKKQTSPANADVSLEYVNGMPHLTIRLPSRNELCQFALKPISHTVGHLLAMLREEDRGIDRAAIINKHGVRIASSCTIERLLDDDFCIQINNRTLQVQPPEREKITVETIDKMGDVRKIIGQLYEAFNVGEYQLEKSNQLAKELETLRYELEPLEEKKMELAKKAERRTNMMTWVGLGLMSVQFGILARLTWWEYSWDIMEPVTYFVTYGTTMAMYAYYCVTKREYIMENVYNREYSLNIYRNAKKIQFDVEHYNRLKRRTAELEYNLSRLNDPINMNLPAHLVRTQLNTPPIDEFNNSDKSKKDKTT